MSYEGYVFHEFPKSLYRDGEHAVAGDAAAEKVLRDEGWDDWHADQAAMAAEAPVEPPPAAEKAPAPKAPRKPRTPRAKKA